MIIVDDLHKHLSLKCIAVDMWNPWRTRPANISQIRVILSLCSAFVSLYWNISIVFYFNMIPYHRKFVQYDIIIIKHLLYSYNWTVESIIKFYFCVSHKSRRNTMSFSITLFKFHAVPKSEFQNISEKWSLSFVTLVGV